MVSRGTLLVEVNGSKDAVVLVDKREWGRGASIKIELEPGTHELEIRAPGRKPIDQHIEILAGQPNAIAITVPPLPLTRPTGHVPPKKDPIPTRPKGDDDLLTPKGHH